jgi:uncharacterized protein YjbI with pentapeptide repeats
VDSAGFPAADLSAANLSAVNFSAADLSAASFSGTNAARSKPLSGRGTASSGFSFLRRTGSFGGI